MKKPTVAKLKKKLDAIFSQFIRQRDKGECFTCGDTKEWKYQQCGHYVSRSYNATRFSEENCNAQCVKCNVFKYGASDEYAIALMAKFGKGILQKLAREKRKIKQWSVNELEEKIEEYKIKLQQFT